MIRRVVGWSSSATPIRPPMPRPYVTLTEYPMDMVRLACTKCERRGQR